MAVALIERIFNLIPELQTHALVFRNPLDPAWAVAVLFPKSFLDCLYDSLVFIQ